MHNALIPSLFLSLFSPLSAACCTSLSISIANLQLSWGIICARLSVVSSIDCGLRGPAAWCGAAPHTVPAPAAAAARQPSRASQPVRYHVVYCGSFPAAAVAAALFEPFLLRPAASRGSGLVSPRCCASFHRQQLRQHHHYPQVTRKKVN